MKTDALKNRMRRALGRLGKRNRGDPHARDGRQEQTCVTAWTRAPNVWRA